MLNLVISHSVEYHTVLIHMQMVHMAMDNLVAHHSVMFQIMEMFQFFRVDILAVLLANMIRTHNKPLFITIITKN